MFQLVIKVKLQMLEIYLLILFCPLRMTSFKEYVKYAKLFCRILMMVY